MRINLVTPFAEKDAAKALGARWDSKTKNWYIVYVAELNPFLRWIPDADVAAQDSGTGKQSKPALSKAPSKQAQAAQTSKPAIEVPHCGCNVLPWDDCIHTAKA
ncbi:DUF5710 domain-containing protein [Rhodoferax sp.]|uniref:DUF5710 domain-containing protein n=1 Tax=Rhodoferax sp. TaxID=50421 RepID=UPI0026088F34|nr:DUF5710 domain-containing protein [Rhodoferax sp.]MDD2809030.1 DUF5710 domain-containing protein [Rhodoferax sp.]MDD4942364.1 DUF5710 domain-containing protein [Rhodoferax sp.]